MALAALSMHVYITHQVPSHSAMIIMQHRTCTRKPTNATPADCSNHHSHRYASEEAAACEGVSETSSTKLASTVASTVPMETMS